MNYQSIHREFNLLLNLEELGFVSFVKANDPTYVKVSYSRLNEERDAKYFFSYIVPQIASSVKEGLTFQQLYSWVGFNRLNQIYKPIWFKYNSEMYGDWFFDEPTINEYPQFDKQKDYIENELSKLNFIIDGKLYKDSLQQSAALLRTYFIETVLPFYEIVGTLENVHEEIIKKIPHMEVANYINGNMLTKKLIIMKLCNNPNYDEFVSWADKMYEENLPKFPQMYKNSLVYQDVRDILSTMSF